MPEEQTVLVVAGEGILAEAAWRRESKTHHAHSQVVVGRRVWRISTILRTDVANAGKSF